jgi:hypothetical protein
MRAARCKASASRSVAQSGRALGWAERSQVQILSLRLLRKANQRGAEPAWNAAWALKGAWSSNLPLSAQCIRQVAGSMRQDYLMFGLLRRARKRREARERNCPCKQTCLCHKPERGISEPWGTLILLSPFLLIAVIALLGPSPATPKRTVIVGAEVCEVVFVKTDEKCNDRLLHHECKDEGYDQAICPRDRHDEQAKGRN